MNSFTRLCLPILVSSVAVFMASFMAWTVLPHHQADIGVLPAPAGRTRADASGARIPSRTHPRGNPFPRDRHPRGRPASVYAAVRPDVRAGYGSQEHRGTERKGPVAITPHDRSRYVLGQILLRVCTPLASGPGVRIGAAFPESVHASRIRPRSTYRRSSSREGTHPLHPAPEYVAAQLFLRVCMSLASGPGVRSGEARPGRAHTRCIRPRST
jgi:hypothetical protein